MGGAVYVVGTAASAYIIVELRGMDDISYAGNEHSEWVGVTYPV